MARLRYSRGRYGWRDGYVKPEKYIHHGHDPWEGAIKPMSSHPFSRSTMPYYLFLQVLNDVSKTQAKCAQLRAQHEATDENNPRGEQRGV